MRGSLFTGTGGGGETTSESSLLLRKWLEHTGLLWRWCSVRGWCGCAWVEELAVVLCLLCLCCLPAVSRHVLTINTWCCFALVPSWLYFCSVSPCICQPSPCAHVALQPWRGSCEAQPCVLCMGEGTQLLGTCCSGWEGPGTAGVYHLPESSCRGTGSRWSPPCWRQSCWRLGASGTGMLLPPGDHDSPAGHCSGGIPDQWSDTELWWVGSPVQLCVPSRKCSRALPVPWRDCARSRGGHPAQRWARCFPGNGFKPGVMATATTRITSLPINQGETEPQRYWSFVVLEPEQYHLQSGHKCQHCDRSGAFTSLFHGAAAHSEYSITAQKPL
ncbi:PREDICTED: uncharacterized protein LOC108447814 [Corvus brachyrhynchos]|uniref:uncharacterized protein LOC108447814 n=1 Tax=Corvus brachyrhynchos TaxID=85066 RepID=UPI0008164F42|nr:PREDICTED: uncharacterized protein LOC108447814 [Corvus brachyrhynchos]